MIPLLVAAGLASATPLPPEIRKQLDRAMQAAKGEDYELALRYLGEAEQSAPLDPEVLADLGEVHASAGHSLAAIAWKEAWLYSVPRGTSGEKRILSEVQGLKTSVGLKLGELAEQAQEAADAMADSDPDAASLKRGAEDEVVGAEIKAGMTEVALGAATSRKGTLYDSPAAVWAEAAKDLAAIGDFEGAMALLPKLPLRRDEVVKAVYDAALSRRDRDAARTAARALSDATRRSAALEALDESLALERLEEDDPTPAEGWAARTTDQAKRQAILLRIMDAHGRAREWEAAEATVTKLDESRQFAAAAILAMDRMRAGEEGKAKALAAPLVESYKSRSHVDARPLSLALAIEGDYETALSVLGWTDTISGKPVVAPEEQEAAWADVAEVRALRMEMTAAGKIGDRAAAQLPATRGEVAARVASVLAERGKITSAIEQTRSIGSADLKSSALASMALSRLKAKDPTGAENLALAMPLEEPGLASKAVETLFQAAQGFADKSAPIGFKRVLGEARSIAIASGLPAELSRIASLEEKGGDPDAARQDRRDAQALEWAALARQFSQDKVVTDLDAWLKEQASPDVPGKAAAEATAALGERLQRITRLLKKKQS